MICKILDILQSIVHFMKKASNLAHTLEGWFDKTYELVSIS